MAQPAPREPADHGFGDARPTHKVLGDATRRPSRQIAIMNAVPTCPCWSRATWVLQGRDSTPVRDHAGDVPGHEHARPSGSIRLSIVRSDSVYNEGGIDCYRMCEWGIMKRAVEANAQGLRRRKIVALGASMSKFAIVVARDSTIYEPEMLKDQPIAVTPNNGSEFTTLKMMEGFLAPEHVKRTNVGR